jgi:general secretion pathway protein D
MKTRIRHWATGSTAIGLCLVLSGCAAFPKLRTGSTPALSVQDVTPTDMVQAASERPIVNEATLIDIPKSSDSGIKPSEPEASAEQIASLFPVDGTVDATLPPQALPQFLDAAFGQILKVPYALGPGVADRQDVITLRSGPQMSQRQFLLLLQTALRDYGLRLYVRNGTLSVLDDKTPASGAAAILRSRSANDTPEGSRTVVQFFQLQTLEANAVQGLLTDLFPPSRAVSIRMEGLTNSLAISGAARDVQSVASFLQQLDKPMFEGAQVVRLEPIFWGADSFAKALEDTLTAEGYKISRTPMVSRTALILSMPTTNQVLVFVSDPEVMKRVKFWARELDQANAFGDKTASFVYDVKNASAKDLGALVMGNGGGSRESASGSSGVAGTAPASSGDRGSMGGSVSGSAAGGSIMVDPIGNRIMFTGTAAQFAQLRSLLEKLDTAPPQVLIEVTVAEVTLTDATKVGLEWFFSRSGGNINGSVSGGTRGGLGIGSAGLALNFTGNTDLRAAFNAFASNNKVNIISRPRLLTKSGEEGHIQVGTDVPIITSQAASNVQNNGATSVLQSVQYRQTGVILTVKPVVYGGNRVDLEIKQELSKVGSGGSAAIASPPILNRSLETKLSIIEGSTSVLGGLIDNNYSKSNSGIPFLKDLPLVGSAFRQDVVDGNKTELIMLVTPFIIRDSNDMDELAAQMSGEINKAFRVGGGSSYTLTGIRTGLNLGLGLPQAVLPVAGKGRVVRPVPKSPTPPTPATASPSDRP